MTSLEQLSMLRPDRFFRAGLVIVLLTAAVLSGCAPKVRIQVARPAEVNTTGIRKVAIGSFEVISIHQVFKVERNGKWEVTSVQMDAAQKNAVSNQVRARVVNLLSASPVFQLVYTDEFQKLETDAALQKLIAAGGYRTSEVDAVINGRIWLDVTRISSSDIDKVELEYVQGIRDGFNYTVQTLAYWPFKSISGVLGLEMKMTRLNPNETVAAAFETRQASYRIGGKPGDFKDEIIAGIQTAGQFIAEQSTARKASNTLESSKSVLPNFEQMVADLSESIAASFARRVSVTQVEASYPIATGGNASARLLIEAGAHERAIEVLNQTLSGAGKRNPDDIYNLGLCYEATGDYGVALVTYNEAIAADPENLIYAQGIGRLERLKREKRRFAEQLARGKK